MSWFVVDDGFHSHAKVRSIPRGTRAAAIGLWMLAGTWAADKLTDGYVPDYMVDELDGSSELAAVLVAAKLWRVRRGGFVFVNWSKYQLTREQVEARRQAERDRKAAYRDRNRIKPAVDPGSVPPGHLPESEPPSPSPTPSPTPLIDQSSGELDSEQPGAGPTGDNPVESVDNLDRIAKRAAELTGMPVDRVSAKMIAEHYLDRAKAWPANPTRFVLVCLTREELPVLTNFVQTGRWSS